MKIKLVSWIREAHGKSGDTVFREVNGETIVGDKPGKRKAPLSDKQQEVQYRFTDARDFYRKVKLVPELYAMYETAAEAAGKSVYMMCRKDWYSAPLVRGLELKGYHGEAGGVIKFKVQDDILAEEAIVTLSDGDEGTLIEWGQAVRETEGTNFWMYTATTSVPAGKSVIIQIEAYDYPGNKGQTSGEVITR
jgi:hypothetical protein